MLFHMPQRNRSRAGFVLAGGRSSRMGTDKAFLEFKGQTLLDHALKTMADVCDPVAIVGDPAKFAKHEPEKHESEKSGSDRYESPKHRTVIADIFPGCGPLAGIHAALKHSTADLNLMLAVDLPFVSAALLTFLFEAAEDDNATDAIVTVPRAGKGLQPLCAIYRRAFCTTAEQALLAGNYKIDGTFSGLSVRVLETSELASAGFSEQSFFNLNTPQDRAAAEGGEFCFPS
jgi:molybdopterin-guanine dinucleotide biosynthesis protein A